MAVGKARDGKGAIVADAASVGTGARAVRVSKMFATIVPTSDVLIAFGFTGVDVAAALPQPVSTMPRTDNRIQLLLAKCIRSSKDYLLPGRPPAVPASPAFQSAQYDTPSP